MREVFGLVAAFSSQLSVRHNRVFHSSDRIQSIDLNSLVDPALRLELPEPLAVAEDAAAVGLLVAVVVVAVRVDQFVNYLWDSSHSVRGSRARLVRPRPELHLDYIDWNIVQNKQPKQQIHQQMLVV